MWRHGFSKITACRVKRCSADRAKVSKKIVTRVLNLVKVDTNKILARSNFMALLVTGGGEKVIRLAMILI